VWGFVVVDVAAVMVQTKKFNFIFHYDKGFEEHLR